MLAENGRLQKLNTIINSFKIIMAAHRGDLPCVVTTAKVPNVFWFVQTSINIKYAQV